MIRLTVKANDRNECGYCERRWRLKWWLEVRLVDGQHSRIFFCTRKHARKVFANLLGVA